MTAFELITVGVDVLWFALQAAMRYRTRGTPLPRITPVDKPGIESPAIVNMAVNDWQATDDAVTATLVDLAARGVLTFGPDPERVTIHLPEEIPDGLRSCEYTLLLDLRSLADNGVVTAEALENRPADTYDRFLQEITTEADTHGRVRKRWSAWQRAVLIFASLPPAILTVSLYDWAATRTAVYHSQWFLMAVLWPLLALFALRSPTTRPTPRGSETAARWLGYREFLRESPDIVTARPADLAVWGRTLAYATALGLAEVTLWLIPAGRNDRTIAWSNRKGSWQKIKIWYPWMLGWGQPPGRKARHGLAKLAVGALLLIFARPDLVGDQLTPLEAASWTTSAMLTGSLVALAAGVLDFALLLTEAFTRRIRTGVVLRQSTVKPTGFSALMQDNDSPKSTPEPLGTYLALQHGDSPKSKAYIVREDAVRGGTAALKHGTKVELRCGSGIGWVTEVRIL